MLFLGNPVSSFLVIKWGACTRKHFYIDSLRLVLPVSMCHKLISRDKKSWTMFHEPCIIIIGIPWGSFSFFVAPCLAFSIIERFSKNLLVTIYDMLTIQASPSWASNIVVRLALSNTWIFMYIMDTGLPPILKLWYGQPISLQCPMSSTPQHLKCETKVSSVTSVRSYPLQKSTPMYPMFVFEVVEDQQSRDYSRSAHVMNRNMMIPQLRRWGWLRC